MKTPKGLSELVIVTGLSGAGKTTALKVLEDIGFYCIDNLPIVLIESFLELVAGGERSSKVAIGLDVRNIEGIDELPAVVERLREKIPLKILFLEADDSVLLKRFKETRRRHPVEAESLSEAIKREREILSAVREEADLIVDTSDMSPSDFRKYLVELFCSDSGFMSITVVSFGYRKGIPQFADMIFDVRFLPNPYYVEELRALTGMDEPVKRFVYESDEFKGFFERLKELLLFLIPLYKREGRGYLNIGIGCTGGVHRSVAVAERVGELLASKGYKVDVFHRELNIIYCSFKGGDEKGKGRG